MDLISQLRNAMESPLPGVTTDPQNDSIHSQLDFITSISSLIAEEGTSSSSSFLDENVCNANDTPKQKLSAGKAIDSKWPSVWGKNKWEDNTNKYPWLGCKNGKLGCKICKKLSLLGAFKSKRTSTIKEWCSFSVTFKGETQSDQLLSLRRKIHDHRASSFHKKAEKIVQFAKSKSIKKVSSSMNVSSSDKKDEKIVQFAKSGKVPDSMEVSSCHKKDGKNVESKSKSFEKVSGSVNVKYLESTKTEFRTAYYLAKNSRPYSDIFDLLQLQKINGIDIEFELNSRKTVVEIVDHVSDEMKKRIINEILDISGKISILIDESDALGSKSTLIVYLKCEFSKEHPPHVLFLDLIEMSNESSVDVVNALLSCLNKHGFDGSYLKENLISFASDGASVTLGKGSGVAELLLGMFPRIIIWYCLSHKLELVLSDAVDELGVINCFQRFIEKIYSLYLMSPKNQHELAECASKLEQEIQEIGKILGTRWIASSFLAVSSVWDEYSTIYNYFEKAKTDKNRSITERDMDNRISRLFSSSQFLQNLANTYDILAELSLLSEGLQNSETTVVYADKLIRRSLSIFEDLKRKHGAKSLAASDAVKKRNFKNVRLSDNPRIEVMDPRQLITSVINNLNRRLPTTSADKPSKSTQEYDSLLADLKVLEADQRPANRSVRYGEMEVENLCKRFTLNKTKIINGYRDYIEDISRVPKDLTPLFNCIKLIPCSSPECELGFSFMNQIITDLRPTLSTKHISSLLFIKHHGPNMEGWNVEPYVKTWKGTHRTPDDMTTRRAKRRLEEENPYIDFL